MTAMAAACLITMTVYGHRIMKTGDEDKLLMREILLSFWKAHILHHASAGPVVGQWMLRELYRHGYAVSPGTLYPMLRRMERHGWLRSKVAPGGGPRARREHFLTAKGAAVLRQVRAQIVELHREVVLGIEVDEAKATAPKATRRRRGP